MIERLGQGAHLEAFLDGLFQSLGFVCCTLCCSDSWVHILLVLVFIVIVIVGSIGVGHFQVVGDSWDRV